MRLGEKAAPAVAPTTTSDQGRSLVCHFCQSPTATIADLGKQPIAQDFRPYATETIEVPRYRLAPAICLSCGLVQIDDPPAPDVLFTPSYPYRSGVSDGMRQHLRAFAERSIEEMISVDDPFFLEIGSNDGTLSSVYAERNLRHLSIDPARDAAMEAKSRGVNVLIAFFSSQIAERVRCEYGPADCIVAANVIAHIPDIADTALAVKALLAKDGLFIFDAIYLGDVLEQASFDVFYDEHHYTFSASAVDTIFKRYGLEVVDIESHAMQGGSKRYYIAHAGRRAVSEAVRVCLEFETLFGVGAAERWNLFKRRTNLIRDELCSIVRGLRSQGKRVAGYGAAAKATVVTTFCGFDSSDLDCVYDTTPSKVNTFLPGSGIPIRDAQELSSSDHQYLILFAWNFLSEIDFKEKPFRMRGGRWIVYHDSVRIL